MTMQFPDMPDPVSATRNDPYWSAWAVWINVTLDGQPLNDCIAASAKEGWVERLKRGPDCQLIKDGDNYVQEMVRGRVELAWNTDRWPEGRPVPPRSVAHP